MLLSLPLYSLSLTCGVSRGGSTFSVLTRVLSKGVGVHAIGTYTTTFRFVSEVVSDHTEPQSAYISYMESNGRKIY